MKSATEIQEISLYRCESCRKLICYELAIQELNANKQEGICKCGSRKIRGTLPINWQENILCLWWRIRFAWHNLKVGIGNVSHR